MTGQKRTNATGRHRAVARTVPPGRRRRAAAPALVALCLAGAATLAGCGGNAYTATVLRGATGVTVVAADGSARPAVDGETLRPGETVRTSTARAALVTGGRTTTLDTGSALTLVSDDVLRLDQGTVVVDHRHGPGATLDAGPVTVSDIGRTAVRVERGFAVRVAVYDGGAATAAADQRSVTVAALHELAVPGSSLPATATPLALRDDALDAVGAPDLVAADVALGRRAAGLDAPAAVAAVASVRTAVLRTLPTASAAVADVSRPLSERVLPVAIARADAGAPPAAAYAEVTALRAQGGSWGVVAALVGAGLGTVQQQLAALLATTPDTSLAPLTAAAPPAADGLAVLLANAASPAATSSGGTSVTTTTTPGAPGSAPTATVPAPTPTTTPLLSSIVGDVVGGVGGVVGGVTGLVPGASSTSPRPSATPTSSSGGLLGGLLGGG